MAKKFTLGKQERLKSRKAMDLLFSEGKSLVVPPFRIVYLPVNGGLLFAAGVSTRNFKRAVDRNKIKRQTREAYRLQKMPLKELLLSKNRGLHVFFTYTAREIKDHKTIVEAVQKGIVKLLKIVNESTAANT